MTWHQYPVMAMLALAVGVTLVLGLNAFSGSPAGDPALRRAAPSGQVNLADFRDLAARRAQALQDRRRARVRRLARGRARDRRLAARRAAAAALAPRPERRAGGATGYQSQGLTEQRQLSRPAQPAPQKVSPKPDPQPQPRSGSGGSGGGGGFDDSG